MSRQLITAEPLFDKPEVRIAWLNALGAEPVAQKTVAAGTAYELSQDDYGKLLIFTSNTAVTVTLPNDVDGGFTDPCRILLLQYGTGAVNVVPESGGITIETSAGTGTRAQFSMIGLEKIDTDEWLIFGDLIDSGSFTDGDW